LDTEDIEDAKDVEINNNAETMSRRTRDIENKQERTKQNRSMIMCYEGVHLEKRQWVPQKELSVAGLLLLQAEGSAKHVMMPSSALTTVTTSNAGTTVLVQNHYQFRGTSTSTSVPIQVVLKKYFAAFVNHSQSQSQLVPVLPVVRVLPTTTSSTTSAS
jgi:hypothetical protein